MSSKHLILQIFITCISISLVFAQYDDEPTICLDSGACYIGGWYDMKIRTKYARFEGIRYAQAPTGDLRFKSPQPYSDPEGTYDISEESDIACPQFESEQYGREDCLFLKIQVPESVFENPGSSLPVMIFIHGGSLLTGDYGNFGPNEFMLRNIVTVAINYRLGPLGFLAMGNEMVPGNAGLRDQNMAIKWVKDNIQNFGGNPDLITIFGESAGSFSVSAQIISPLSKGLFRRAICQSGPAISPSWGRTKIEKAVQYANMLASNMDCNQKSKEDMLSCMQSKSLEEIYSASDLGFSNAPYEGPLIWASVVDGDFVSDPFFPQEAEQMLQNGNINTDVDVIIGSNSDEGLLRLQDAMEDPNTWEDYRDTFETAGTKTLFNIAEDSEITSDDLERMRRVVEFYVGSIDNINEDNKQNMLDMFTDCDFLFGTYKTIRYMLQQNMNVYQYILSYEGSLSSGYGVTHGEDLVYLFDPPFGTDEPISEEDQQVRNVMMSAWTNFAEFGDPKNGWTKSILDSDQQYWNITGAEPSMEGRQEVKNRMTFWDQLFE